MYYNMSMEPELNNVGRPKQSKEYKEVKSFRVTNSNYRWIKSNFGSVQSFIDFIIGMLKK